MRIRVPPSPRRKNAEKTALLKLLVIGERDVIAGRLKPVIEIVNRLRAKLDPR